MACIMVFCGKPSKGCSNCRKRRIKCDQLDPACSQCLRAGKTCDGYRNQLNLMFRNENEKVMQKARGPKQHAQQSQSPSSLLSSPPKERTTHIIVRDTIFSPFSEDCEELAKSPFPRQYCFCPSPLKHLSTDDLGVQFFFNNYMTTEYVSLSEFLTPPHSPPLMAHQIFLNESFHEAISSVGYAALSNVSGNSQYHIVARKKYVKSISNTTTALKNTSSSNLDFILMCIVLLAMFEIVTGTAPGSKIWSMHLDGAAALLKLMTGEPRAPELITIHRHQLMPNV